MRKLGRNEPCYCGSGEKYKRCCLPLDEANNIVRLAPKEPPQGPSEDDKLLTYDEVKMLIEQRLTWDYVYYEQIAEKILHDMSGRGTYSWDDIAHAIVLWHAYCHDSYPTIRSNSASVLAAAIEYIIAMAKGLPGVTKAGMAEQYGVSATSVTRRVKEIMSVEHFLAMDMGMMGEDGEESMFLQGGHASDHDPKWQAQALLHQAWETENVSRRLRLARQALQIYPDSPDAYNILAESARNLEEARELYLQGMKAGERELGDLLEEDKGFFWGLTETRPFMRSKQGYAETCELLGDLSEAVRHYEELLELNPGDNQGIRYMLIGVYCQLEQYEKANELLERYEEDTAYGAYDRMLVEYGLHGLSPRMKGLLREARKSNPYVPAYLTGKKRLPSSVPQSYIVGDESEAVTYALERLYVWSLHMPLVHWLHTQR